MIHDTDPRLTLSIHRKYEIDYKTGADGSDSDAGKMATVEGTLICLDEQGFVVVETASGRMLIPKDSVVIMREKQSEG